METEGRGMKVLYTVFLLSITAHTIILLVDRLSPKETECNCKKPKEKS
jgi:hypothetical protein